MSRCAPTRSSRCPCARRTHLAEPKCPRTWTSSRSISLHFGGCLHAQYDDVQRQRRLTESELITTWRCLNWIELHFAVLTSVCHIMHQFCAAPLPFFLHGTPVLHCALYLFLQFTRCSTEHFILILKVTNHGIDLLLQFVQTNADVEHCIN